MPEQESQSISSEQLDLVEQIERRIFLIRGHKVLPDSDLAKLYDVSTGHFNEQVRRNHGRFPADFMFALTAGEADALRSQIAISKAHRGGRRYLPLVFTEQGVAMLSSPFQHLHLQSHLKLALLSAWRKNSASSYQRSVV